MADEEEVDHVQAVNKQVAKARPPRRIAVREHDTDRARTAEVVEFAQSVLDTLATQRDEQSKADNGTATAEAAADGAMTLPASGPSHKEVATLLKRKLDETYGGTWHAIVGTNFGGNVTNDAGSLVNFTIDGVSFLVLRSGPPERPHLEVMGQSEGERGGTTAAAA